MSKWEVTKVSASKITGEPQYYCVCALGNPDYVSTYEDWGFARKDDAEAVAALLNERMKARKLAARKKEPEKLETSDDIKKFAAKILEENGDQLDALHPVKKKKGAGE